MFQLWEAGDGGALLPDLGLCVLRARLERRNFSEAWALGVTSGSESCPPHRCQEFAHLTWCPHSKRRGLKSACDFMHRNGAGYQCFWMFISVDLLWLCGAFLFFRVLWLAKLQLFRHRISPKDLEHQWTSHIRTSLNMSLGAPWRAGDGERILEATLRRETGTGKVAHVLVLEPGRLNPDGVYKLL